MKYFVLLISALILAPSLVFADVRITEIAWMGTTTSSLGEWFELYNDGPTPVNLSGWKLYKDGGNKLIFTLSKTIGVGEYILVERTTPSVPDPIPGVNDEAGTFSNSGFSNAGESLVLKDIGGTTIQSLDYSTGWPAGDSTTKDTMQWYQDHWVTATPTAKSATLTPTINSVPQGTDEESTVSTNAGGVVLSTNNEEVVFKHIPAEIVFTFPSVVHTGVPYDFVGDVVFEDMHPHYGYFVWSMGDGMVFSDQELLPNTYTYLYPGTYTVVLAYYNSEKDTVPLLQSTKKVTVTRPSIELSQIDTGSIQITNLGDSSVDLAGWKMVTDTTSSDIPILTSLAAKATIVMRSIVFGVQSIHLARLLSPGGILVASLAST